MGNELISNSRNVLANFENMIQPGETVKKISRRTKVTTDLAEHTLWEVARNGGKETAIFKRSKLIK